MPKYPGLGLPLRHGSGHKFPFHPIGAHSSCYESESFILPVRELAMMSIMERLTDKEDWHKKVFNPEIILKWRKEAMDIPDEEFWNLAVGAKKQYWGHEDKPDSKELILDDDEVGVVRDYDDEGNELVLERKILEGIVNDEAFNFCIRELQRKARYFEGTGLVPTLDACATVVKSDTLVPQALRNSLRNAFDKLKLDHATSPDWHPNSNEMVQDLVHPSMYPLVYGRSLVLEEESVGVENAIATWAGKGDVIEKEQFVEPPPNNGDVPSHFWSDTYQWLPSNLAFQGDGSLRFTSYINNLHPNKYADIYRTIEQLAQAALPAWDQCLSLVLGWNKKEGTGRLQSRFSNPEDAGDSNNENWIPSEPKEVAHLELDVSKINRYERHAYVCNPEHFKWEKLRKPRLRDPDHEIHSYSPAPGTRLVDRYKTTGLQVIVKLASIELTPEKPDFPAGSWHVEGQMNEHICATALYYLDSENITPSSLSLRMQTSAWLNDDISVGQDEYHWLEQVYGTQLGGGNSPCLQNYGSVETKEGRLLAFPNVFQHRVSPFKLQDPTKPGHRRFIALWLVDPTKQIISTANVPPQQQDWWAESVLGSTAESRKEVLSKLPAELVALLAEKGVNTDTPDMSHARLPVELMDMVREHFNANSNTLPMSAEEARMHRAKLMEVRGTFVQSSEKEWQEQSYNFCEH